MQKFINLGIILTMLFLGVSFGCKKGESGEPEKKEYDFKPILKSYVDETVIPTYADMKNNAKLLLAKVKQFKSSSAQEDLKAACDLWVKTRKPWEASEAFLFGPAAFLSLDPLLDSWPLDRDQLQRALESKQELSVDFVRNGLGANLRGFHTIEFLIFREGKPRTASDVTEREKEYLVAVTEVLRDDCIKLWASWEGGSSEKKILESLDFEVKVPYGDEFKKAGNAGSRYNSEKDAIDDILQGIMGIADEVGNAKIADPHKSGNVLEVESWFSWNSLTDFTDNIQSIENSYIGGYFSKNGSEFSISKYVKEKDAELDKEVKAKIKASIDAIKAIPQPFRNNLKHENVKKAMDKLSELNDVFDKKVRKLVFPK